jgi:ribose/xylose/arabinose/galactoside ABC-type transport system permease subunit
MMDTDRLFARFVTGLFIILSLFGLGMTVVIIFGDSDVGLRMVNAFASMFVAVLGFGSGYLLGQNRAKSINGKEDTHDGT